MLVVELVVAKLASFLASIYNSTPIPEQAQWCLERALSVSMSDEYKMSGASEHLSWEGRQIRYEYEVAIHKTSRAYTCVPSNLDDAHTRTCSVLCTRICVHLSALPPITATWTNHAGKQVMKGRSFITIWGGQKRLYACTRGGFLFFGRLPLQARIFIRRQPFSSRDTSRWALCGAERKPGTATTPRSARTPSHFAPGRGTNRRSGTLAC
ncbi:hypothetical protein J3F84DRAFT_90004 [Trichoderma pleuroticola]